MIEQARKDEFPIVGRQPGDGGHHPAQLLAVLDAVVDVAVAVNLDLLRQLDPSHSLDTPEVVDSQLPCDVPGPRIEVVDVVERHMLPDDPFGHLLRDIARCVRVQPLQSEHAQQSSFDMSPGLVELVHLLP